MQTNLGWTWPRGAALRYCFKVSVAALMGYLFSIGGSNYSMYGAFTAALVVGSSRGEDVGSAKNRVWGSLSGMLVGIAASNLAPHPGIAVALGIGATAYLCMACGWGQAAARIGASMCAVMILAHSQDAVEYSAMRMINTMIGIGAGLAVSYFVLPARGSDLMAANIRRSLDAVAHLLAAVSQPQPVPDRACYVAVFDSLVAIEKTLVDAQKEIGAEIDRLRESGRQAAIVCIGALAAGLAHLELEGSPGGMEAAKQLRAQAAALAERAKAIEKDVGRERAVPAREGVAETSIDHVAMQGFALGLRKIDDGLRALGH